MDVGDKTTRHVLVAPYFDGESKDGWHEVQTLSGETFEGTHAGIHKELLKCAADGDCTVTEFLREECGESGSVYIMRIERRVVEQVVF